MSIKSISKHGGSTKSITLVTNFDPSKFSSGRKSNNLKVAVQIGEDTKLCEIDPSKLLVDFITEFTKNPNLSQKKALYWIDKGIYITEENRNTVANGAVLKLQTSPSVMADTLLSELRRPYTGNIETYKRLSIHSKNSSFADEFLNRGGLTTIIKNIESDSCVGEALAHALASVLDLMDYNTMLWDDVVTKEFLNRVLTHSSFLREIDVTIHQNCLAILEGTINSSKQLYNQIMELGFSFSLIKPHLDQSTNPKLQFRAISVANAMLMRAPIEIKRTPSKKRVGSLSDPVEISFRDIRQSILNNIVRSTVQVDSDMAHQLHVFQALTFKQFEKRMHSKVNSQDRDQRESVLDLSKLAFDHAAESPIGRKPSTSSNFNPTEFKNLGFLNFNNPVLEFDEIPPGLLALDCMKYFAAHQQDNYIKLVLENSSRGNNHQCPFARSSIQLVKILCQIFQVGELPTETSEEYYPIAFIHDHILEELYCVGIVQLNKTWKEMSAIDEDFDKVMNVVSEQLKRAIMSKPMPASLDQLKTKLQTLSYSEILKLRQIARQDKEILFKNAKPVLKLQEHIKPEIMELIKGQRINVMLEGCMFNRVSGKKFRDKLHWYCRLSPNLKFLHYGDLENTKEKPSVDELKNKIAITDIQAILIGRSCPHIKNARSQHKVTPELAFSIKYDPDNYLNFMAPDVQTWCLWTDGLNKLIGKKMSSEKVQNDLEILLTMEMKLRLLDLETIPILEKPPPIPQPPDNFNFAMDM